MFHLIRDNELEVTFDIASAEDHLPSVAFNLGISWNMPFQNAKINIKECWFSCSALDEFEESLKNLIQSEEGKAILSNLSSYPILSFTKSGSKMHTELFIQDTSGLGKLSLKVDAYSSELPLVLEKLRGFEKWW